MNTRRSRAKSAVLNMLFNFLYQMINTIVNIILPPLIISKFGSVMNGLISTIKQFLGYIQLLGAGISESTVVSLYKPLASNDEEKISSIFNACSVTFFRMGLLFNIASIILALLYPFFIKEDINYTFLVSLVLILSIAGASEFYIIGKCRSLLIADQRIYIVNIAQIVGAIANLIVTISLIKLDFSIIIVQFGASIIYAMRILIVFTYVKRHYVFLDKKIQADFQAVDKRKAATVHQLAGLISFGSQTIVVSIFCGLAEASVYSVYNLVFTGINTILSTISSALLATFGDIMVNDDSNKLRKLFSLYETFYFVLVFILYSITYIMFLSFISIYTKNTTDAVYVRPEFALLFCIMGIVNCLRTPGATLINAIGHYAETKNRAVIEMMICFILEIILVKYIGIVGVLIATILAFLYRTIDIVLYSNHILLNQSTRRTLKKIFLNLSIFIVLYFINKAIDLSSTGYLDWTLKAIKISFVIMPIYLFFNFLLSKDEYYILMKKIVRK